MKSPCMEDLKIKIFADGANLDSVLKLSASPWIRGFTTNPTLMRQAGVQDYRSFARDVLQAVAGRPVSFEVLSDDLVRMEAEAETIAGWGPNVFVKVPITTTEGRSTAGLIRSLGRRGVRLNVTAILTGHQVDQVVEGVAEAPAAYVSVFAGRIADTGRDPIPVMRQSLDSIRAFPGVELIWASPRELLNIIQADSIGCHIITVTHELLGKLHLLGRDLSEYSLETVRMLHRDAMCAGYTCLGEYATPC